IEFRPGVVMVPLRTPTLPPATHTNAYLLGTGPLVLVDPGSPSREEQETLHAVVRAANEKLGGRLTAVWLTHHHPHHVGAPRAPPLRGAAPAPPEPPSGCPWRRIRRRRTASRRAASPSTSASKTATVTSSARASRCVSCTCQGTPAVTSAFSSRATARSCAA